MYINWLRGHLKGTAENICVVNSWIGWKFRFIYFFIGKMWQHGKMLYLMANDAVNLFCLSQISGLKKKIKKKYIFSTYIEKSIFPTDVLVTLTVCQN